MCTQVHVPHVAYSFFLWAIYIFVYHKINHTHRVYVTLAIFRSDGDDLQIRII